MRTPRFFMLALITALAAPPAVAGEIINDITGLNPIYVNRVITPTSIEEVSRAVGNETGPVCIGGGRYSQGGQTATENCLHLNMRGMNRILSLDIQRRQITVEAGITWRDIQEAIDPHDLSLKIMQSFSNFTVGGSLSVNAHGRYVGEGALIRSVESIALVLADGSVAVASRNENPGLFFGAIGGYGGLGVIVQATLNLAENTPVARESALLPVAQYKDYFTRHVRASPNAVFHNADLYPPDYAYVNAVTWSKTEKPVTVDQRLAPRDALSPLQQSLMWWVTKGPLGKQMREHVYDPVRYADRRVEWRNYEASYDVIGLEPPSRKTSTYVLQEYFIPVARFDAFAAQLAAILKHHGVNVINVSIRHSLADPETLLSWAKGEVFSFVIYYQQGVTEEDRTRVREWTGELIEAALAESGTYYLPYQILATREQFLRAYPAAPTYFALKRRVDPAYKFRNKLWDSYYRE